MAEGEGEGTTQCRAGRSATIALLLFLVAGAFIAVQVTATSVRTEDVSQVVHDAVSLSASTSRSIAEATKPPSTLSAHESARSMDVEDIVKKVEENPADRTSEEVVVTAPPTVAEPAQVVTPAVTPAVLPAQVGASAPLLFEPHPSYPHYFPAPSEYLAQDVGITRRRSSSPAEMQSVNTAFDNYLKLHSEIISGQRPGKYVVMAHYTEAGFGNLLPVLVSTFLLAFASDRAFLIDWPYQRPRKHFNGEEYMGYPDIKELLEAPAGMKWRYDEVKKGSIKEKSIDASSAFYCKNLKNEFKEDMLRIKSWDFFGPGIVTNPNHAQAIREAFGEDWYGTISRWLIRPIPSLREEIRKFVRDNFDGRYVVGLQIRKVGMNKLSEDQVKRFFSCAEATRIMANEPSDNTFYFIAADNAQTREAAKKKYGAKAIQLGSKVDRASTRGVQEGLIDNFLLAFCDDQIISGGSTYGRQSAGYSSLPPMVVKRQGDTCVRIASSTPCFYEYKQVINSGCVKEEASLVTYFNYAGMSDHC
eukprot:CAMPEP_0113895226 /NCGR_PEP_ID=MMETSP0780_2-20120614/17226_1 /TAXON_ID=652834 /ORGANISM="Palpitomonas bilix" /LENGTH=529 /DNA_ID=CAMNT_0000885995 /DNA_START=201 /DNA_END=1790 /DNA_ORIENTATION=- /assembly_acc=CAM_ASM_000599